MNRAETFCKCTTCKLMCKQSPCFSTPEEAVKLIQAGYQNRLAISIYADQETGEHFPAVTGHFTKENGCVFQDEYGYCELHGTGLKPMEGRLAHHSMEDDGLRLHVARLWHTPEGLEVIKNFPTDDQAWKLYAELTISQHMLTSQLAQL